MLKRLLLFIFLMLAVSTLQSQNEIPCTGTATTTLNIRSGPGTNYRRIGQLQRGMKIVVIEKINSNWVKIEHGLQKGYVHSSYLEYSPLSQNKHSNKKEDTHTNWKILSFLWDILCLIISIYAGFKMLSWTIKALFSASIITTNFITTLFKIINLPFYLLNILQRYLAKPWILFIKSNRFSDNTNEILRCISPFLKAPFYIILIPLRFINAAYFNLLLHCLFEMFNYITEVFRPSDYDEGCDNTFKWFFKLPWRIIKYPLWHGSLTIIESSIWTIIDIFLPALTLFHGTSQEAADCIVASPGRGRWRYGHIGIWHVGSGNYAGNGIYFAPFLRTAKHYSSGSLIICRVTLGTTLDLGLAPYHVFRACGHPNAFEATRWGLNNGYVTGEWWRPDEGWWEYCMYDWQNRYNFSWRIRPLYVMNLETGNIQRIHGGMCHWLFRRIVIKDIIDSFSK